MRKLVEAVEKSIEQQNAVAAVSLAVLIPDIFGKMQYSGTRYYKEWFEANMPDIYRQHISGSDAYAIRCALLHSFGSGLSEHRAHEILEKYEITTAGVHLLSMRDVVVNGIRQDNITIINAYQYAGDIVGSYKAWRANATGNLLEKIQHAETNAPMFESSGDIAGGLISFS